MKTAYVVQYGYENEVLGVFNSKSDAEQYALKYREWGAHVNKAPTDPPAPDTMLYSLTIKEDGTFHNGGLAGGDGEEREKFSLPYSGEMPRKYMWLHLTLRARDMDEAEAKARFRYDELKDEWPKVPAGTYSRCERCRNLSETTQERSDRGGMNMCSSCHMATWPGLGYPWRY